MNTTTAESPTMLVRAASVSGSLDVEARTIDVIFASETPVRRRSWETGLYDEVLLCGRANVDLSRADNMSLLDTHGAYSLDDRLGAVMPGSVRFERGQVIAKVKLSRKGRAEDLLLDLQDGMSLPISVGYRILQEERTEAPQGGVATVRATLWQPIEISVVPIPADPNAKTRGIEMPEEIIERQEQPQRQARQAVAAEAKRRSDIEAFAGTADLKLDDELVRKSLNDTGCTLEQFRNAVLDKMVADQARTPTFPHSETRGMQDAQETTRRMIANAILHRNGIVDTLEEGARQWRSMSDMDIAKDLLRQRGENVYGGASDIAQRALHTTSDFPIILGDVARQTVLASYRRPNNTFQLFAHRNIVKDLREVRLIDIGSAPDLKLVLEHGEYTSGTIRESADGFTMAKYGRKIGVTEEILINDQLGAVLKLIAEWGRKAAKLEGDLVWDKIINNALMSDGKGLFHADHNNLAAAGTALDKANLIKARLAFRQQKDIDGEPTDIAPKYLFTGAALEIDAQTLIAAAHVPTTVTDAVPQAIKSMVPVYEYRLDKIQTKAWFLFADQNDSIGRGIQYAHLAGYEEPRVSQQPGFDVDGVQFKIKHFFGVGVTDYRFAYKNPGVPLE
jgi:phage head maturation protease